MALLVTIVFSLMAFICFCGLLAEKELCFRKHLTICYCASTFLVLAVNIVGYFL